MASATGTNDPGRTRPPFGCASAPAPRPHDRTGPQVELRLIVEDERTLLQRPPQPALQAAPRPELAAQALAEEAGAVPPVRLGPVEGDVRMLEQLITVAPASGNTAIPMLPLTVTGFPSSMVGSRTRASSFSATAGIVGVGDLRQQDRELIPAQPGHRVALADAAHEPAGHDPDQRVAGRMAEGVVHLLELVEVDQKHGRMAGVTLGQGQRPAEPVAKEKPVGQAGQRVMVREPADLLLGLDLLGAVLDQAEDGAAAVLERVTELYQRQ